MLQQETKVWTVRELMKISIDLLEKKGFDETRLTVELLLSHALHFQRIQLYTNFDKPLAKDELADFRRLLERRLNREPVQYIVGAAHFMGLPFRVDRRVLIPRPETETLVEQVMLLFQQANNNPVSVLEIGTGSGNIAVALAKFLKNVSVTSIDVSSEALEVAALNAKVHEVDGLIAFERMDVFEPVDQLLRKRFDIFVSNPPYVSMAEWEQLQQEVRNYEPKHATSDGKDGFVFFRRLVELAPYVLRDEGRVVVEVGFGQADTVKTMMEEAGFFQVAVVPDLQSIPRVVMGGCHSKARNSTPLN